MEKLELTKKDIKTLRHIFRNNKNIENIRKENELWIVSTFIETKYNRKNKNR